MQRARKPKCNKKCMDDDKKCAIVIKNTELEGLSRDMDTFWQNDLSAPPGLLTGHAILSSSENKFCSFTHQERQASYILGLLPFNTRCQDLQLERCKLVFSNFSNRLRQCIFLMDLYERNRKLFFRLLLSSWDTYMPVLDSDSSDFMMKNFSLLLLNMAGMNITIKDKGHVYQTLRNWPHRKVRCILVTDGSSVLNFGDYGANSMATLLTKLFQNTLYAGIHPDICLPLVLDVGTDNPDLKSDHLYVGLREARVRGDEFEDLFEEFTQAVLRLYGPRALILCMNIEMSCAVKQLQKYRKRQCFINIDLQCHAASALAGLLAAQKITELSFSDNLFMFHGTSLINVGIAFLCLAYFKREGMSEDEARQRIWFCDEFGLLALNRPKYPMPKELLQFQKNHKPVAMLEDVITEVKPNVLVGCSYTKAFNRDVLNAMEKSAKWPIIFAMSKPFEDSECTPEEAFVRTKGRCIFISGSALKPVQYANKWYQPGFCTNIFLTSGIVMGVIMAGIATVTDEVLLAAAERMSDLVWPNDLAKRNVFPPLSKVPCVNKEVAEAVFQLGFKRSLATLWPKPSNPVEYLKSQMYTTDYAPSTRKTYCMVDQHIGTTESGYYYTHTM